MKILHLIPHLSGGGAERQLNYLAPELARMGHDVHIAHTAPCQHVEFAGVTTHYLKSGTNYDPLLLLRIFKLVRILKPDVIHTWILQMDILGGIIASLTRTPWIIREPSSAVAYLPTWKNRLRVRVASKACAIVANSAGGEHYWALQLPLVPRFIIRNGLLQDEISASDAPIPLDCLNAGLPIILYVGRLTSDASASKNLTFLLQALAHVRNERKFAAVLCGEGPQRAELEQLSESLGLACDVHFTGYLPSGSVWSLMKRASVFISLSAYEGCPNSVMEAMVCGCPLVLSDIPAHREILDETSALFVNPADTRQICAAIVQSLSDHVAAGTRVASARSRAGEWSVSEMSRSYEKIYKELATTES